MSYIKILETILGDGKPKICVPLTPANEAQLRISLAEMKSTPFDLIEWRADKYAPDSRTIDDLLFAASVIKDAFPDKPLIFTIRTSRDMEDFHISDKDYADINSNIILSQAADLVDIEYSRGSELLAEMVSLAHSCGVKVIASKHVRDHTPEAERIVSVLTAMQGCGADIVKYAAMPQNERDVLTLLDATLTMKEHHDTTPFITMSMGRLGVLSRISGLLSGSCLTFGTIGTASAPGQLPCERLRSILDSL